MNRRLAAAIGVGAGLFSLALALGLGNGQDAIRRLVAPPVARAAAPAIPAAGLIESTGKVTLLRVHDVGSGYGPPTDFIDIEVIVWLDTQPGKAFGFQLRNDSNRPARQGMLDLLRDAFNNNWIVTLDYEIDTGKKNGTILRVWVTKPPGSVVSP